MPAGCMTGWPTGSARARSSSMWTRSSRAWTSPRQIFRAVAACTVLLAVIGPAWLTAADERGRRRLDDPDDLVRLEIEAALARGVRVIPILVEGAVMPGRADLPESLAGLARRNALLIRHESFRSDAGRLVTAIERVLAASGTTAACAVSRRPSRRRCCWRGRSQGLWACPDRCFPRRPTLRRRRTQRRLQHPRVLEASGADRRREGTGSHQPRPRRPASWPTPNASPTPSPATRKQRR